MDTIYENRRDITSRELAGEMTRREAQELRHPSGPQFLMTRAAIRSAGLEPVNVGQFSKLQRVYRAQSSSGMSHPEIVDSWTLKDNEEA